MPIDYSELNGLEVLLLLLSGRDGYFLWGIIGFALLVVIISHYVDKNDEVGKVIDHTDQRTNM